MIGIYKITSPTNKVYIGQSIDVEKRFKQYKNLQCKGQGIVYKSLLKYSFEKHKFEILCECEVLELNEKERYYQELFNAVGKNGLNCQFTNTTEFKRLFSDATKLKMSESAKKRIRTEEEIAFSTKRLIEINIKRRGIPKSESTKQKLRIANLGTTCVKRQGFNHANSKIVLCVETGIYYGSAKLASVAKGINYATLKDYLNGRRNIKNNTSLIYV